MPFIVEAVLVVEREVAVRCLLVLLVFLLLFCISVSFISFLLFIIYDDYAHGYDYDSVGAYFLIASRIPPGPGGSIARNNDNV